MSEESISTYSPLSGGDRIKIVSIFILLAGTIFFGIIPIMIMLSTIYIMKKDKNFISITKSKKYIKIYLIILALATTVLASIAYETNYRNTINWGKYYYDQTNNPDVKSYDYYEVNPEADTITLTILIGGVTVATPISVMIIIFILNKLFYKPLEKHQDWIVQNGIFSDNKEKEPTSTSIMGRDKFTSFSIADEMLKWNSLLEKGLITQDEFGEAKKKLLSEGKV